MICCHRPIHEYHQDFLAKLGCTVGKEKDGLKDAMQCLQSKQLKDIFEHSFFFDECNILTPGFGGYGTFEDILKILNYTHTIFLADK